MAASRLPIYFILFAFSGFSGLIYESIWTHYLKLFLGHAAYAQTLVLAMFMGGMAIGSWICSRYSTRWNNLLLGYAVTEAMIGLCAIGFHAAFTRTIELSYAVIIPHIGHPTAITAFKWSLSALMILPQSILLGMTFPLMSCGILRLFPGSPGKSIAMLYFTNSIGAAIGVVVSGFMLIKLVGLPGTIVLAGAVNLILALTVWFLANASTPTGKQLQMPVEGSSTPTGQWYRLLLLASLLTGAASFIYEIGWIRMLNLVLGTSTHAFELMLSAFIFGLALGGLWIQRRIEAIAAPERYLGRVQVLMGLLALSTLLLYGHTFEVMQWLVATLGKTDSGYALFNLSSSAIAMGIMLPTTFCAGMTLPLITVVLMRSGDGERSIGAVYAANTIGAIVGVFFAIHIGMPLLGLKGLITLGASLDIALGVVLLWKSAVKEERRTIPIAVTALGAGAVAATVGLVHLDLLKMGSGVYRYGIILPAQHFRHLYHLDGKTATIDVFLDGLGSMRINTNGKTDATIMTDPERSAGEDESTMVLLAAIPMALHPQATSAASIGLGSGLTTHTLLCNPTIREVDTIEIEQGVIEGAKCFRPSVDLVYTDPRSKIHVDDAKTFFSSYNKKYDLIISEPSNPWVSGVSGLFSKEFYRVVKRNMKDDGLFVQWVQLYEIDVELVMSILKSLSGSFSDFAVYAPDDVDLVIVAKKAGEVPDVASPWSKGSELTAVLNRIQIQGAQDIAIRKIGSKKLLLPLIDSFPVGANSDYFPFLDQNAARTRFLNSSAQELLFFGQMHLPVLEMLTGSPRPGESTDVTPTAAFPKSQAVFTAMAIRDYFLTGTFKPCYANVPEEDKKQAVQMKKIFFEGNSIAQEQERLESIFVTGLNTVPYLAPAELESLWRSLEAGPSASSLSAAERELVALFRAVGRRDAPGMGKAAKNLLERSENLAPAPLKYLLASGMAGYLMQGDQEESYRLWLTYKDGITAGQNRDLLFRLLVARSTALH